MVKERASQEYKNALTTIEEAGTLMSSLVTKLLTLARLSAAEIRKESMDLGTIIGTAVRLLRFSAESRQIDLAVENRPSAVITGDPPAILWNSSSISWIMP